MKFLHVCYSFCILALLVPGSVCAAPLKHHADIPSVSPYKLKFSGYADASYNYLSQSNQFTSGIYDRVYDINMNGFTLQQIGLTLSSRPEQGFGGLLNAVLGRDASNISPPGLNSDYFSGREVAFTIGQAYLQYTKNTFTGIAGEMLTLAGIETYEYPLDKNFSRSIVDGYAQPGIHIGLRGIKRLNNEMQLIAGINNGWSGIREAAHLHGFEAGLNYTPSSLLDFNVNIFSSPERLINNASNGRKSVRNLIDMFGTWHVTNKISLAMNADYGLQHKAVLSNGQIGEAVWDGIAGYLNYKFNDKWRASFRAEIFEDQDGYQTGIRQNWREATFSLAYSLFKDLQIRAETRHDISNKGGFKDKTGSGTGNNQQSYSMDMLVTF